MCDIKTNAELRKIDQELLEKEVAELAEYDFTHFTYDDWKEGYLFVESELRKSFFKGIDAALEEHDSCLLPYLFNVVRHMRIIAQDIPKTHTLPDQIKK
ncbi:MAG TPA: hypothetical protein VFP45_03385 [Candidatus Nitrosotalea sp.]|nr:hypothetical protein [Candidatus Nitrosotalea sp.]